MSSLEDEANRNAHAFLDIARHLGNKVDPALNTLMAHKIEEFIAHVGSSRQRPRGENGEPVSRWEDSVIAQALPEKTTVLDLGCGDGELLAGLMHDKDIRGQGVELDPGSVMECVRRGVPVLHINIDGGLKEFPDKSFDFVVLEETLQTLMRPMEVLLEILRVGRQGVVSFPNFAYWRVRLDLAVRGRMPVTEWLPFSWYDTPNIHLLTLQDFMDWAAANRVEIKKAFVLAEGDVREMRDGDNLHAEEALLFIERV